MYSSEYYMTTQLLIGYKKIRLGLKKFPLTIILILTLDFLN